MTKSMALAAVCATFLSLPVHAGVIVSYEFTGGALTPTSEAAFVDSAAGGRSITAADSSFTMTTSNSPPSVTSGGTISSPGVAPVLRIGSPGVSNSGWQTTSYASAVAGNDYIEFTLTPASGMALDLETVSFDYAQGGTTGTRGVALRYSFDAFATFIDAGESTLNGGQNVFNLYTATLSDQDQAQGRTTGPVTFRIYGYTGATGRALAFDNITVEGTQVAVPEPASCCLLAFGALGLMAKRRRK